MALCDISFLHSPFIFSSLHVSMSFSIGGGPVNKKRDRKIGLNRSENSVFYLLVSQQQTLDPVLIFAGIGLEFISFLAKMFDSEKLFSYAKNKMHKMVCFSQSVQFTFWVSKRLSIVEYINVLHLWSCLT